ncbi:MAG: ABC transporter ATP-binding protein, partial [Oscillospiraceae bacterium]
MFKLFKKYLGKYKWVGIVAIAFIIVQSLSEISLPGKMQAIIDRGITPGDINMIWKSGFEMLGLAALISVCAVVASLLIAIISSGFAQNLRKAIFVKVTNASNNQISKIGTASLITRTTNDVNQLQLLVVQSRFMFMVPILGIGSIILALINVRQLSWIMAIVGLLLGITVFSVIYFASPLFKIQQAK